MILLVVAFALATARGRRTLASFDPLFALLVVIVLALPYLIWLMRSDVLTLPPLPEVADLRGRVTRSGVLLGGLVVSMAGIALLLAVNSPWFARKPEEAPTIYRKPVDPLGRQFVYFFAFAPALIGSLLAGLFRLDHVVGGAGVALLLSGLAVIVNAGDLIHLYRQRLLRSAWAATIAAPAAARRRDDAGCPLGQHRGSADLDAGGFDRAFLRRQF